MKRYWQHLSTRIDALTLRERAIIFALAALVLITLMNALAIDPLFARTKILSAQIHENQSKASEARELTKVILQRHGEDPDAAAKAQLEAVEERLASMQAALQDVRKGLVSPDKMSGLLESILRRHGNLRLIALRSLPPSPISGATEPAKPANGAAGASTASSQPVPPVTAGSAQTAPGPAAEVAKGQVFKHGVEVVVQGSYSELVGYMAELESMPWQVFWGKASLNAEDHARTTLTLTLYTLSLEKRWLDL